jgi:hypothetical protein
LKQSSIKKESMFTQEIIRDSLTREELTALYDTFVVIRRSRFSLAVWRRQLPDSRRFELAYKCRTAVGAIGYQTPGGPHFVIAKAKNPDWLIPNSQWAIDAGLRPGTIIPGGAPENPIREAFLRLTDDGVGIHGTENLLSLRSRASHGCIRVTPQAAQNLYLIVPVGSPVFIV